MPSWKSRRLERQSEKDLKRHTVPGPSVKDDTTQQEEVSGVETPRATTPTTPRRNRRMRDSVVSLSAVNDPPNGLDGTPLSVPSVEITPAPDRPARTNRFSLMRFRHASDSQLNKTAKEHADNTPPMPVAPPSIITTAPTSDNFEVNKRKSAFILPRKNKGISKKKSKASIHDGGDDGTPTPTSRVTFDEPSRLHMTQSQPAPPPAYGDEYNSALALPISRMSESSRSDGSSGDHGVYATTTTTHTVSTTTTFFRLPRRKKDKGPLFPLPPKGNSAGTSLTNTPRLSTSGRNSESPSRPQLSFPPESSSAHGSPRRSGQHSPTHSGLFTHGPFGRSDSRASTHSRASSRKGRPSTLGERGRSSTFSSLRNAVDDPGSTPVPPLPQSTRTSTSTAGRPSLGGLFSLSRLRQPSEPLSRGLTPAGPGTPGSMDSKQNSFNLPREPAIVIPERQEGDTPAKYLARLEEVVNRSALIAILSKHDDEFTKNVMRSYMRRFKFYEDPLDMAVRKMLMHVDLPKETQQIDRTLQSFADRYQECNPGIFPSPDDAYFIAFSVLILHTDVFNKNNKNKMQKPDYVKNAKSQGGTTTEVLECFYDNISYTPFIHVEDDLDITPERLMAQKPSKKGALKVTNTPSLKRSHSGPLDPYTLLMDGKLDTIRPSLDDVLPMDDSFNYLCDGASINVNELNRTFYRTGILQILSSRSRPGAFANQATISNPSEAQVGVVDMKVTKVGLLWRKDTKKKKTRSPWQEWGAILTGSQLYFFRNTHWAKGLMSQYEQHQKHGRSDTPVVFKPPLEQFKPDFVLSIEEAVALVDDQYKKHKNAFVFTRQNNFAEVLLSDNESELRDWLTKLNYAATYRTAGVRMKGVIRNSDENHNRHTHEDEPLSPTDTSGITTPDIREPEINRRDEEFSTQVLEARRQIMVQKIAQAEERMQLLDQQLDAMLRSGRQLKILAPIQVKTREDVRAAAVRLATHTRVTQMERWRIRCHCDILMKDLEEDRKFSVSDRSDTNGSQQSEMTPQVTKESHQSRSPFGRFNSKHADSKSNSSRTRPSNQKLFSMDEIFRSPSRIKASNHRPKGSWELPPLNFDRRGSVQPTTDHRQSEDQVAESSDNESTYLTVPNTPLVATRNSSEAEISSNHAEEDEKEREILAEAGVLPPDTEVAVDDPVDEKQEEKDKAYDTDDKDGLSKVRHSLQRKLHGSHVPSHRGSRRGKDSVSSAGATDDTSSTAENEVLTRSNGSFTVHGKKASIVTFGSEWQNMSPEERMRRPNSGTVRTSSSVAADGRPISEIPRSELKHTLSNASSEAITVKSIGSPSQSLRKPSDASSKKIKE